MTPQLYLTMYKEQFRSPGRVRRTELRPTSAHRRNNPQPRPDFLYPRSLLSTHGTTRAHTCSLPPVDTDCPLFPPVKGFSSHGPVLTCPENSFNTGSQQHMPPIDTSGREQKLQQTHPPATTSFQLPVPLKNPQKTVDYQNGNPLSARQLRLQARAQLQTRPQTCNSPHCFRKTQSRRCCSNSDCYSCFHVVRPYQAGHYIIHPEFVSESLY